MAAPNIAAATSIIGKTAVLVVTNSATAILSNAAGSGKLLKVNALLVGNVDAAVNYDLTADVYRAGVAYRAIPTVTVPAKASLDVLSKYLYLEEGDALRLTGSATLKLEAVCSYEEIS